MLDATQKQNRGCELRESIPGCEGFEASDDGNIYKVGSDRPKKRRSSSTGQLQVDIGGTTRMVHDLVARAFHGDAPAGYRAKPINGDWSDTRAANLVWSGSPALKSQSETIPLEIEREYERMMRERQELIDLMES